MLFVIFVPALSVGALQREGQPLAPILVRGMQPLGMQSVRAMQENNALLIVDVGTSSLRVALLDEQAHCNWIDSRKYRPSYLDAVTIEQDPEVWWNALDDLLLEAQSWLQGRLSPRAMVLTSQRSSVIPVDRAGRALRPAIMWQDKRHTAVCARLEAANPDLQSITGAMMNTAYSGPKMAWLRENEPEVYEAAYKLMTPAEFMIYRLTGEARTDFTYASRSLLFDLRSLTWHDGLLEAFGLDRDKLCDAVSPGSEVGRLEPAWCKRWQLPEGLPLLSAGGDQQCSALGLGVVGEGRYELTAGTGGYVMTLGKTLPKVYRGTAVNVAAIPGFYNYETTMITCSSAFDYFCRLFYPGLDYKEIGGKLAEAEVEAGAADQEIVVLPFFQGSGSPDWASFKKADILGLDFSATAEDITLACLQAIACEFHEHIDLLEDVTGVPASEVVISGGLTRNESFSGMLASLLRARVLRPADFEASVYGAWMSAAVSLGIMNSFEAATAQVRGQFRESTYRPQSAQSTRYRKILQRYRDAKNEEHVTNSPSRVEEVK